MTESERPKFKSVSDLFGLPKEEVKSERDKRLMSLTNKDKRNSLQLAATMALQNRKKSPQSKIRDRQGFVTATRVPDVFEDKQRLAKAHWSKLNKKTGQYVPDPHEYSPPKDHVFRVEKEIEVGMQDFKTRIRPEQIDNPHFLSAFDQRPRYQTEKEKRIADKLEAEEKFAKAGKPHDFIRYNKMPDKLTQISAGFKDKHNKFYKGPADKAPFLEKEQWVPYWIAEQKKYKDDFVHDKDHPKLNLYYNGLRSEHLETEFDGTHKPFKLIT